MTMSLPQISSLAGAIPLSSRVLVTGDVDGVAHPTTAGSAPELGGERPTAAA
jgi:hypothetical protein